MVWCVIIKCNIPIYIYPLFYPFNHQSICKSIYQPATSECVFYFCIYRVSISRSNYLSVLLSNCMYNIYIVVCVRACVCIHPYIHLSIYPYHPHRLTALSYIFWRHLCCESYPTQLCLQTNFRFHSMELLEIRCR